MIDSGHWIFTRLAAIHQVATQAKVNNMSDKAAMIKEMIEMQKQFIDYEHKHGISGKDYYASDEGLLADYRQEYMDLANRVVDIAHEINGSSRNF